MWPVGKTTLWNEPLKYQPKLLSVPEALFWVE